MNDLETLKALAQTYGIATGYWSSVGEWIEASEDTLLKTLEALHVDLSKGYDFAIQDHADRAFTSPLPDCVVAVVGDAYIFPVHVHDGESARVTILLEDGSTRDARQIENWTESREIAGQRWGEASFELPTDLPTGWHRLHLESGGIDEECSLIVTPTRLSTTDYFAEHPASGVMAQLYSVRSRDSWGIGDFADLATLAEKLAKQGADYLLINPIHAAEPVPPIEDSPYLPTSRRFVNPIYLRVEDVEEYAGLSAKKRAKIEKKAAALRKANTTNAPIERNPIYRAKLKALKRMHKVERSPEREAAYSAFIEREGESLMDFATWCAGEYIRIKAPKNPDIRRLIDFFMWLQFLCDEQLEAAQRRAKEAGMQIGIITDLAVGVHPGGADAANYRDALAPQASVGAPADGYNQDGQDWSQPPWNPVGLAKLGYRPWRDMLRSVLRHSGAIRVDHVLGLFRLFWIPRMQSPLTGTYVNYNYDAMVGILALEAERAGCLVIGEDLGTFEPWVQDSLSARGIMGTSILWFEHAGEEDRPKYESEYRVLSLASVTTHDLPPTTGYLDGAHISLRNQLGMLHTDPDEEFAGDLAWQNRILDIVRERGCFEGTSLADTHFAGLPRDGRGDIIDLLVGLHRYVARTPAALACAALVDLVGDQGIQNQPGTVKEQYPNWCIPLCDHTGTPILLEDLESSPVFQAVAPVALQRCVAGAPHEG